MLDRPDLVVTLADGRDLAADVVGATHGRMVLYVHGTPDSRVSRHPDDHLAAAAGVRLVAVDRPGFGWSDADPDATLGSVARDLVELADHVGAEHFAVLAWSGGAPYAVALAARAPDRVAAVGIAAGTVPVEAFADPEVRAAADPGRVGFADLAAELSADELAAEVAPYLVPDPVDDALAREVLLEGADAVRVAELEAVPGALERLALGVVDSVRAGRLGLERDVAIQATPSTLDLARITVPVHLWYGSADPVCPPAFGRWWADQLANAELDVVDGAGHALVLTRWEQILRSLAEVP